MDFAIISPTAGLERYATLSKTHLVLAHYWDKDEAYRKFYHERQKAGDFIILDNGAYEGVAYFEELGRFANEVRPNVLVLPDFYLQPWQKTWHTSIAWLDRFDHEDWLPHETQFCYIPQSTKGDFHGFIESYIEAVQDSRITWLGIPRALATDITGNPLARVEFARLVRKEHPNLHLHAFGMVNGDIHELGYLADAGVNSIDSSAPVWRGWNRYHINGTELSKKECGIHPWKEWDGRQVDFAAPYDERSDVTIRCNLEACNVRVSDRVRTTTGG